MCCVKLSSSFDEELTSMLKSGTPLGEMAPGKWQVGREPRIIGAYRWILYIRLYPFDEEDLIKKRKRLINEEMIDN